MRQKSPEIAVMADAKIRRRIHWELIALLQERYAGKLAFPVRLVHNIFLDFEVEVQMVEGVA